MTACLGCNGNVEPNPWGNWCYRCGGVYTSPEKFMFRHVATVKRASDGMAYPIVFDLSTGDYAYMMQAPNPRAKPDKDGKVPRSIDGFKPTPVQVLHGSLDAMIAMSYRDVRVEGGERPTLSPAPSATVQEWAKTTLDLKDV